MKHPDHVVGWNASLEALVTTIGNLRYDVLARFVELLAEDIRRQGLADDEAGRHQLATRLSVAATDMATAHQSLRTVWTLCEPYIATDGNSR